MISGLLAPNSGSSGWTNASPFEDSTGSKALRASSSSASAFSSSAFFSVIAFSKPSLT